MNSELAPKGEGTEEGLELAGEGETSSRDTECAEGSQGLRM